MSRNFFLITLMFSLFAFVNVSKAQTTEFWIDGTDTRSDIEVYGTNYFTINALFDGEEDPNCTYEWYIGTFDPLSNMANSGDLYSGYVVQLNDGTKTIALTAEDIEWAWYDGTSYEQPYINLICKITRGGNSYTEAFPIYNQ